MKRYDDDEEIRHRRPKNMCTADVHTGHLQWVNVFICSKTDNDNVTQLFSNSTSCFDQLRCFALFNGKIALRPEWPDPGGSVSALLSYLPNCPYPFSYPAYTSEPATDECSGMELQFYFPIGHSETVGDETLVWRI